MLISLDYTFGGGHIQKVKPIGKKQNKYSLFDMFTEKKQTHSAISNHKYPLAL